MPRITTFMREEHSVSYRTFPYADLRRFCLKTYSNYGFSSQESEIITDTLLCADLFGIESHGVQRMNRYHNEISKGLVKIDAKPVIILETHISAVLDADKSMGQVVSARAMDLAIKKAKTAGIGMITVRNSNHHGISGYFANMACKEDLMGVCMTNAESMAVPTFGKEAMCGTNPIALAFPADPVDFLFDASTTVVTMGKVEVYKKNEELLPENWAVRTNGHISRDAVDVLRNIAGKLGGGILPLGGLGENFGGHKGYGLGIIVDLFTGILSSGKTSNHVNRVEGQNDISHFFMAVDYGLFGDKSDIQNHFSSFLHELRNSRKADGQERIYTHGEKEVESRERKLVDGIPLSIKTVGEMQVIAESLGININNYLTL